MRQPILILTYAVLLQAGGMMADEKFSDADRRWWAFQPVAEVAPPAPHAAWAAHNEVDHFLHAKLAEAGLTPSADAPQSVVLRRLTLVLTGLPPSAEQQQAFAADQSTLAVEKLVDSLLASPRYGEHMARFWLDLVRYADSDGYKADEFRPHAWRYRDWVVRSFNQDLPYRDFMSQQIAGDELAPHNPDALIATGYLRHGIYEYNNRDAVGQRLTILNDITDTTSDVFLGLGLQCARCHDHKFDPLLQEDYYRLQAFFTPLNPEMESSVPTKAQAEEHRQKQEHWEKQTEEIRREIDAIQAPFIENATKDALSKFPPETQAIFAKSKETRSTFENQVAELTWRQVTYEHDRIEGKIKGTEKEKLVTLRKRLAEFDPLKPPTPARAHIIKESGPQAPPNLIPGGETKGDIAPGVPVLFSAAPLAVNPTETGTTGRRKALAEWMGGPGSFLTARVMVNRVWQMVFGRGLSSTTSDFGTLGEKPTHPELLDWLTAQFIRDGWSIKKLHRRLVVSAAFQRQAHPADADAARLKDPQNRLLAYWSVRRLQAEQIRDSILMVTGELDPAEGGPAVDFSKPRRSIYNKVLRNVRDPVLDVFDSPQHINSTPDRNTTTTPLQSLLLANHEWMLDRATAMARQLNSEKASDQVALLQTAALRTWGRSLDAAEIENSLAFLAEQEKECTELPREQPFLSQAMPQRNGTAALLSPNSAQQRLVGPESISAEIKGDFAIETVALLRSVAEDGVVRVAVSTWDGKDGNSGFSLGITGKKSRRKAQMLLLQLAGKTVEGAAVSEPVFSDLIIQLDRSYYLAASVRLATPGQPGEVTFFMKDLANDDEPLQSSTVPHPVARFDGAPGQFVIGNRSKAGAAHYWDGLVDEIRLRQGLLTQADCFYSHETTPLDNQTIGCWNFEGKEAPLADATGRHSPLQSMAQPPKLTPKLAATADFCQSLLSSSEFLYLR